MLALLRRASFSPPSMVYISVNITHIKNYNLSVVRSWVFWVLSASPFPAKQLGCDVRGECIIKTMGIVNTKGNESVLPFLFKKSRPCRDLNRGPRWYQADTQRAGTGH